MIRYVLIIFLFALPLFHRAEAAVITEEKEPNDIMEEMVKEIKALVNFYKIQKNDLNIKISKINYSLTSNISLEEKVNLLIEKDQLKDQIIIIEEIEYNEISKIRYIKGLQIMKLLYEKILSLDHHFSSIYTFTEINKISNPNSYPEFLQVKDLVLKKKKRKLDFDLGSVLGENPIISATQTFIGLLDFDFSSNKSREELFKIECILDFTLSMHNELNTVYFETTFLKSGNDALKENIETLFTDYTKPVGYEKDLESCRKLDDWDSLRIKLNAYLKEMEKTTGREQFKKRVDLEFPIDRLLQFISEYNSFIDQGEQFYRKFKIILSSYESNVQCITEAPVEYSKLKNDVDTAIEKFQIAYRPIEINGSKMKEILYGLNEYE